MDRALTYLEEIFEDEQLAFKIDATEPDNDNYNEVVLVRDKVTPSISYKIVELQLEVKFQSRADYFAFWTAEFECKLNKKFKIESYGYDKDTEILEIYLTIMLSKRRI